MTDLKIKLFRFASTTLRTRFTVFRSGHITRDVSGSTHRRAGTFTVTPAKAGIYTKKPAPIRYNRNIRFNNQKF